MRHHIFIVAIMVLAGWLSSCAGMASSEILIEFHRTGGIAGFKDYLTIKANGEVTLTRETRQYGHYKFTLDRDTMNQLQALLDEAEFSKLRDEYLPPRQGYDFFEYTITYKGHTVRTMDTAIPKSLRPILDLLNEIVDSRK